jgi:hypothetical protein
LVVFSRVENREQEKGHQPLTALMVILSRVMALAHEYLHRVIIYRDREEQEMEVVADGLVASSIRFVAGSKV